MFLQQRKTEKPPLCGGDSVDEVTIQTEAERRIYPIAFTENISAHNRKMLDSESFRQEFDNRVFKVFTDHDRYGHAIASKSGSQLESKTHGSYSTPAQQPYVHLKNTTAQFSGAYNKKSGYLLDNSGPVDFGKSFILSQKQAFGHSRNTNKLQAAHTSYSRFIEYRTVAQNGGDSRGLPTVKSASTVETNNDGSTWASLTAKIDGDKNFGSQVTDLVQTAYHSATGFGIVRVKQREGLPFTINKTLQQRAVSVENQQEGNSAICANRSSQQVQMPKVAPVHMVEGQSKPMTFRPTTEGAIITVPMTQNR